MAVGSKSVRFAVLALLVVSALISGSEAGRPLNILNNEVAAGRAIERFFEGLALGSIKDSGPSPGVGHSFTNSETLGGIKNSGPSPGVGHRVVVGSRQ
ncbi:PAMP-induced secreted peptide 2 [Linum perenne]